MQATLERILASPLGGDAVGFVGCDVPIDVLLASGRPFGHLPWRTTGTTAWADRWLESSFPYWARSILEQWHDGAFDALETVVFSRADDASQRLFYYVRELQQRSALGGPVPHVFDIALLPRESSLAHTATAVGELTRALGVEPRLLPEGIARANRLRQQLDDLQGARNCDGPFYERLARAAVMSDATRWIDAIVTPREGGNRARVLLAGSVPPDERLHRAADAAGACIVAEAHVHGLGRLGVPVDLRSDTPERAIAQQLRSATIGPRAVLDRARWLVAEVAAARAVAVILWLTREDEALAWQVPAQRRALAAAGIPMLVLPAASWRADDGALENVAEFCRGVADAAA